MINIIDKQKESIKAGLERKISDFFEDISDSSSQLNLSDYSFTSREKEIVDLILKGKENKEIGQLLDISLNTVSNHIKNIYGKANVSNRIELFNKLKN